LFELDLLAVADDTEIALKIAERVHQSGRIEQHEAQQSAVARLLAGAQAQTVAGIAQGGRRPLDQADHGDIRYPRLRIGDVGALEPNVPQQLIAGHAVAAQVVAHPAGQTRIDFEALRHWRCPCEGPVVRSILPQGGVKGETVNWQNRALSAAVKLTLRS